jgi:outer membrane protein assembly factor BamB
MLAWQPIDPVHRTFTMTDFETGQRLGYSLDTGDLLWGPVGEFRAFQYYSSRAGFPAYGNLYVTGYGGEIKAFSMNNGTLLWTFNDTSSGIETPWGQYPLQGAAAADGMIFSFAGEHSPNTPLYKGYRVYAVDAFTGKEVWNLPAWSASGLGTSLAPIAIADGFLVFLNAYDGKVYSIGKGPRSYSGRAKSIN